MGYTEDRIGKYLPYILPYKFKLAASPHLAAKKEGKKINANKIMQSFKLLASRFDSVIVEGIGGALVPFSKKQLVIDIAGKLGLPVLIVAGNKLGAINHTLLTIEALKKRKIRILGLVFNNFKKEDRCVLNDNPRIIKALAKQRIFGVLPYNTKYHKLYKSFVPIGKRISKLLLA